MFPSHALPSYAMDIEEHSENAVIEILSSDDEGDLKPAAAARAPNESGSVTAGQPTAAPPVKRPRLDDPATGTADSTESSKRETTQAQQCQVA